MIINKGNTDNNTEPVHSEYMGYAILNKGVFNRSFKVETPLAD